MCFSARGSTVSWWRKCRYWYILRWKVSLPSCVCVCVCVHLRVSVCLDIRLRGMLRRQMAFLHCRATLANRGRTGRRWERRRRWDVSQTWGWFWVVVKTKTTKGERAAGEERLGRTSYYKGERVDEVMNGCMRRMSRGEGEHSCQATPTFHTVVQLHPPTRFSTALKSKLRNIPSSHHSNLIVLLLQEQFCRGQCCQLRSNRVRARVCTYARVCWRALHACWATGPGQVWSGNSGKIGNSGPVN